MNNFFFSSLILYLENSKTFSNIIASPTITFWAFLTILVSVCVYVSAYIYVYTYMHCEDLVHGKACFSPVVELI